MSLVPPGPCDSKRCVALSHGGQIKEHRLSRSVENHSLTLVLGGARSGKSRTAEAMTMATPAPWIYVATAEPFDDEMRVRIDEHKSRRGDDWETVDAPTDLAGAIEDAPDDCTVLVDCLTIWLNNLMFRKIDIETAIENLEAALAKRDAPTVLVSNEVGFGIVPDNAEARRFRDLQGRLNQRIAAMAGRVVLVVAGIPVFVKGDAMSDIDDTDAERHKAKMAKRKAVQDAEVADKKIEKGLLIVHTGTGKGKSTAAFGLALRMLGRGKRVGVVQFIKGAWHSAERDALEKFGDQVSWHTMGEGFTWDTQDLKRDVAAAERAWAKARELMADESFALIILDELNIALRYDYLNLQSVVAELSARRNDLHIVVTGRNAKPELVAAADLVTDMSLVKHHFAAGVKAQPGIEF